MKEIHFYTNLCNVEQTSEWDLDTMHTDWVSTNKAICEDDEDIVKTTQLSFLANAWDYIEKGSRVFIHNDELVFEVKEHMWHPDGKDIRIGHDISKILIGGGFGKLC